MPAAIAANHAKTKSLSARLGRCCAFLCCCCLACWRRCCRRRKDNDAKNSDDDDDLAEMGGDPGSPRKGRGGGTPTSPGGGGAAPTTPGGSAMRPRSNTAFGRLASFSGGSSFLKKGKKKGFKKRKREPWKPPEHFRWRDPAATHSAHLTVTRRW